MKNSVKSILFVFSVLFVLASCNKYEDGPSFSLLTKKARLTNTWKVDKYVDQNGNSSSPDSSDNGTLEFKKNGDVTITNSGLSVTGSWEFTKDKEYVQISYSAMGSTSSTEAKILRLKSKELWIQDPDTKMETHYVPA